MKTDQLTLPKTATNIIFTGVAGTGKTHRLLEIQKLYDETIIKPWQEWCLQHIRLYSWCDVVCAVFLLEDRLMTVPEIMRHQVVQDKMVANERKANMNQTIWGQLNTHAHPESANIDSEEGSANYYFDKTDSGQWYLLEEVKESLQQRLSELMSIYMSSNTKNFDNPNCPNNPINPNNPQLTISRSCLVSFHQSYGYDEFVEGIRPHINPKTGQMQYDVQNGAFLELCSKASTDPEHRYAMLIDEINRANTAQVFGELMSVIEPSKRSGSQTPMSVRLAYSGRLFSVPNNVDIYATMNTQDASLAMLDMAFRRRFEFVSCAPDHTVLGIIKDNNGEEVDLAHLMFTINQRLIELLGEEAQLGHAYFMQVKDIAQLARRLHRQIIPQIKHYLSRFASASQHSALLMQVLYGRENNVFEIEGCLLESRSVTNLYNATFKVSVTSSFKDYDNNHDSDYENDQKSNQKINRMVNQSNAELLTLAKTFTKIANIVDEETVEVASLTNAERLFLSAKPYQQLYLSTNQ